MSFKLQTRELLNPTTGEVEGQIPVLGRDTARLRDDWMFLHKKGCLRLRNKGLSGRDYDVLMTYLGLLDFGNEIQITQKEIADDLGIPQQSVARSTKRLVELKILIEGEKIGRNKTYRLNTFFAWRGPIADKYYKSYEHDSRAIEELEPTHA